MQWSAVYCNNINIVGPYIRIDSGIYIFHGIRLNWGEEAILSLSIKWRNICLPAWIIIGKIRKDYPFFITRITEKLYESLGWHNLTGSFIKFLLYHNACPNLKSNLKKKKKSVLSSLYLLISNWVWDKDSMPLFTTPASSVSNIPLLLVY